MNLRFDPFYYPKTFNGYSTYFKKVKIISLSQAVGKKIIRVIEFRTDGQGNSPAIMEFENGFISIIADSRSAGDCALFPYVENIPKELFAHHPVHIFKKYSFIDFERLELDLEKEIEAEKERQRQETQYQNQTALKKCPNCQDRPAITAVDDIFSIHSQCGFEMKGSDIKQLLENWNKVGVE